VTLDPERLQRAESVQCESDGLFWVILLAIFNNSVCSFWEMALSKIFCVFRTLGMAVARTSSPNFVMNRVWARLSLVEMLLFTRFRFSSLLITPPNVDPSSPMAFATDF